MGVNDVDDGSPSTEEVWGQGHALELIFGNIPSLVALLDRDMRFVRVNERYAEADSRFSADDMVGLLHFDLYPHPENEEIFRRVLETGERHLALAKPFDYGHSPERGTTHWDWTLDPVRNETGEIVGLLLVLVDVTERVRAESALLYRERLLDAALAAISPGLLVLGPDGEILRANAAAETMVGRHLSDGGTRHLARISAAIQTAVSRVTGQFELSVTDAEGRAQTQSWEAVQFDPGNDGESHTVCFVEDITERLAAENEARELREALEERVEQRTRDLERAMETATAAWQEARAANEMKRQLLERVSHELRTPLNSILGLAELLLLDPNQPASEEDLRTLHHAGTQLRDLIDELLDVRSLSNRGEQLRLDELAVRSILEGCVSLVERQAAARGITFSLQVPDNDPIARADSGALRSVVLNLLSNAAKYGEANTEVVVAVEPRAGGKLAIVVEDEGPGIDPADRQRAFEPLQRLGREHGSIEGSGLGLPISRRLVEAMSGTLELEDSPRGGARFVVVVPAGKGHPTPDDSTLRILCVEDDPVSRQLLARILGLRGRVQVRVESSGENALAAAGIFEPHLAILDINLPGIDGFETLSRLRAQPGWASLPAIALTALGNADAVARGRELGFDHYLVKPVNTGRLLGIVESYHQRLVGDDYGA